MYSSILAIILYLKFASSTCQYKNPDFILEERESGAELLTKDNMKLFIQEVVLESEKRISKTVELYSESKDIQELKGTVQDFMEELSGKLADFALSFNTQLSQECKELKQSLLENQDNFKEYFVNELHKSVCAVLNGDPENNETGETGFVNTVTSVIQKELPRILQSEIVSAWNIELIENLKTEIIQQIRLENFATNKNLVEVIYSNVRQLIHDSESRILENINSKFINDGGNRVQSTGGSEKMKGSTDKKLINHLLNIVLTSNQADQKYLAQVIIKMIEQDSKKEKQVNYQDSQLSSLLNLLQPSTSNNPFRTWN